MYIVNGDDVRDMLSMSRCIDLMAKAAEMASEGKAFLPLRNAMPLSGGKGIMGMMPGSISDPDLFGIKLVNIIPENAKRGRSSHLGTLMLFDAENGDPVAVVDAAAVTAVRTAAASALATKLLSRDDSKVLSLIGSGEQAHSHLEAMMLVRPIEEVIVWGVDCESAKRLADRAVSEFSIAARVVPTAEEAVKAADIICTVTGASQPVVYGDWLPDGAHLNAVGASDPSKMEIDPAVVECSRYFVDYLPSAKAQAAELIACLENGASVSNTVEAQIGDVVSGKAKGRSGEQDITVYRSLGNAAQDLCVGAYLIQEIENGRSVQKVAFP